jgi:predicted nucleotidyltransferase
MLNEKFGIAKIGVFGSYARCGQNSKSDEDILVF